MKYMNMNTIPYKANLVVFFLTLFLLSYGTSWPALQELYMQIRLKMYTVCTLL